MVRDCDLCQNLSEIAINVQKVELERLFGAVVDTDDSLGYLCESCMHIYLEALKNRG